jgi:DNA replication and repair protein RecF
MVFYSALVGVFPVQYPSMFIRKVLLERFRIHKSLLLEFTKKTTLIVGANASGKTSIVEALYLLSTGSSFRAEKILEMVSFESELGRVKGIVELQDSQPIEALLEAKNEQLELEVLLTRGLVQGKKTPFRLFSVNGVRRQKRQATGKLKVVAFRPEDMRLVEGSPSRRRQFLDAPLSLLYPDYEQALTTYEQTIVRRNKLLEAVREREQPQSVLQYWNMSMLKNGETVQKFRRDFIAQFSTVQFPYDFTIQYNPSVISQARQDEYLAREIASGHSLIGPHKDDFQVLMPVPKMADLVDVAVYGSRGQQRLAVLWLKTAELAFVREQTQEFPILLLDDILSELDEDSQGLVTDLLGQQQSIVTTIDPAAVARVKEKVGAENLQVLEMQQL